MNIPTTTKPRALYLEHSRILNTTMRGTGATLIGYGFNNRKDKYRMYFSMPIRNIRKVEDKVKAAIGILPFKLQSLEDITQATDLLCRYRVVLHYRGSKE